VGEDRHFKFGKYGAANPSPRMTNHRWKGHGQVTWTVQIFWAPIIYLE